MKLIFNISFILLSLLSIVIILIDFNQENEFFIENGIIVIIILPLIFNILRLLISKINSSTLDYFFNTLIFLCTGFSFIYLGLLSWGHGFTGRETPLVFELGVYVDVTFFIVLLFWFIFQVKNIIR